MDRLFLQGFYTDGSLSRDDDIPIMGFGWIFTSDLSMNIKYSGMGQLNESRIVSLIKVKAHSDNPLNDAADILAKEAHQNLQKVKHYALNNIIDWEYSQLWFKYNSFSKPTSKQYTKHISWRVKCSSHNLPTLDILNRNYPELLQNYETCFLCSTHKETNEHLWNCPQVLILLTPIFEEHYNKFKTLITSESNSLYALYSDSITRNPIFKWVKKPPQQIINIPELHCLLMNFIPTSLTYPFKVAKISKKSTKKLLLKFLFDLYKDIYEKIWKQRAIAWRQFKKS
ncbi:hypothetical protein RhiirA1_470111 [Rhizophagus irregularis]|uniref:Uncharacterized protein n=1 Tax=Rhizophagus irregularis TaxID=588596 RepID=A0A2I1F3B5_9GLOM|nr:hypothetical protein RhiirA1_470111 [Rhizophagus irregularis]PKY28861.1 hypothetical protein RhiirB3_445238 [Rhizophagus irregularis]